MKRIITLALSILCVLTLYILSQKPKVWFDTEWAGLCLTRGHYRSWTARFCDGQTWIDGKLQPVVIENGTVRKGHYHWPKFGHVDTKKLGIPST